MEGKPSSPEQPRGKFASPRDEVLYQLILSGWGIASSGDVQSPSGRFARISNSAVELDDLQDALIEPFESYGLTDPQELVGHFVIIEPETGPVEVDSFETEGEAINLFGVLEDTHQAWERGEI